MVVTRGPQVSLPEEITIAAAQPAVYSVNGSGQARVTFTPPPDYGWPTAPLPPRAAT